MTTDELSSKPPRAKYAAPEALRHRLNEATPNVDSCAWPDCSEKMSWTRKGQRQEQRYGVLCSKHAVEVAVAVVQHQKEAHRLQQMLSEMDRQYADWRTASRLRDEQYEERTAELQQGRDGFVYYLRVGERIKVGFSADVKKRMRQYPPGSELLAVEPGDLSLEKQRHQQFAGSRTDGREWFRLTSDLASHIDALVSMHGSPKRFAHHYRRNESPVRVRRSS